jgi:hypothetical protein
MLYVCKAWHRAVIQILHEALQSFGRDKEYLYPLPFQNRVQNGAISSVTILRSVFLLSKLGWLCVVCGRNFAVGQCKQCRQSKHIYVVDSWCSHRKHYMITKVELKEIFITTTGIVGDTDQSTDEIEMNWPSMTEVALRFACKKHGKSTLTQQTNRIWQVVCQDFISPPFTNLMSIGTGGLVASRS